MRLERWWPPTTFQRVFSAVLGSLSLAFFVASLTSTLNDRDLSVGDAVFAPTYGFWCLYCALLPSHEKPKFSVMFLGAAVCSMVVFASMLLGAPARWTVLLMLALIAYCLIEARLHWLRGY